MKTENFKNSDICFDIMKVVKLNKVRSVVIIDKSDSITAKMLAHMIEDFSNTFLIPIDMLPTAKKFIAPEQNCHSFVEYIGAYHADKICLLPYIILTEYSLPNNFYLSDYPIYAREMDRMGDLYDRNDTLVIVLTDTTGDFSKEREWIRKKFVESIVIERPVDISFDTLDPNRYDNLKNELKKIFFKNRCLKKLAKLFWRYQLLKYTFPNKYSYIYYDLCLKNLGDVALRHLKYFADPYTLTKIIKLLHSYCGADKLILLLRGYLENCDGSVGSFCCVNDGFYSIITKILTNRHALDALVQLFKKYLINSVKCIYWEVQ